jgi:hypothetical protein
VRMSIEAVIPINTIKPEIFISAFTGLNGSRDSPVRTLDYLLLM